MFVNYEDSLQGIILKASEKRLFQKLSMIVFLTAHDNNLIRPIITTQLDHFFWKRTS